MSRTQAEYIANVNEVQRLRRELEATRAELSNARVARDQAKAECAELRAQLEADEAQVKEELARLKFDMRWELKDPREGDCWTVVNDIDSFLRDNAPCEASNILEMGIDREYVHSNGWRIRRVRRRQITPE